MLFGSIEELRRNGDTMLQMPSVIEILMLSAAALILLITRTNGIKAAQGSVFSAGMQAVVAIFGIAWMGDTFLNGNMTELRASIEGVVTSMPWLFGIALFVMSILLYSQAATVRALMPLGIALGISPWMLVALFPAVNGYFFIPNYPTVVAAINFDRTGTTRIGKYVLNHSFDDAGADRNDRGHVDRPVADPVFGTVISAKIFARRFFDFPCQCFLSVSPRLSTGIPSLAPGRIS